MQNNVNWKLYNIEAQGWNYLYNEQLALAKQSFEEGLKLAKQHQINCTVLQFEYQLTQVDVYYTYNQEAAVDRAVRLLTSSKRPEYSHCTTQHRMIYDILLHAYFYRDCLAYEEEIRDSIAFMTQEYDDPYEGNLRCEYILCELDFEKGSYAAGRDRSMSYLTKSEYAHPYRKSDGFRAASRMMFALGELESASKYAELNAEFSMKGGYQSGVAIALAWQAVFSQYLGKEDASRLMERADHQIKQYNVVQTQTIYDAKASYYELSGDIDNAVLILETQFKELPLHGSLHDLALAHLQYCRLLGRCNKPVHKAIKTATEFISTLRKPDIHLAALKRIEEGDFHQFLWQKNILPRA